MKIDLKTSVGAALVLGAPVLLGGAAAASPIVIGGVAYAPSSAAETLTATFAASDGGVTTGTYSGVVAITVSGTGQSDAKATNDAFYLFDGPNVSAPSLYYQLTFGTASLVPFAPAQDAKNAIVYDLSTGQPTIPPAIPSYSASHLYSFVLNTGTTLPAALHFGVSDGDFLDNTGSYVIGVTQLSPVPEPASFTLLAMAATGALILRRR